MSLTGPTKKVVIRVVSEMVVSVPDDPQWDANLVNFHFNDGSYCLSNLWREMGEWADDHDENECPCSCTNVEFLRDATEADCKELPIIGSD